MTDLAPLVDLVEPVDQCNPATIGRDWITYLDISAVDRADKRIVSTDRTLARNAPSRARQVLASNDVLVSTVRPNLNGVAHVPPEYAGEFASTGFCVLRPQRDQLSSKYLYFFTRTRGFVSRLVNIAVGASYPAVTDNDVLETAIPLPDLDRQQQIASTLDITDRLRRTRGYAIEATDEILAIEFRKRFGDRLEAEVGEPLGTFVTITGGGTPSRERPEYFAGHIPWLTSKDMRGDYIWDTEEHVTEEAVAHSATKIVPIGSILLVVKSKVLMHRLPVAIAKVALCHGQDIKSIQCSERLNNEFARYLLRYYEPRLLSMARGANTEGLTLPMLEELPVPSISYQEQLVFAELVHRGERLLGAQREALRQSEHLLEAFLDKMFPQS